MSWDIIIIRTKTNSEMIDEIKSENIIPFRQTEIADAIKKISTELGADYNCDNLSCQYLGGGIGSDMWQIEFLVGKEALQVTSLVRGNMLHLRDRKHSLIRW